MNKTLSSLDIIYILKTKSLTSFSLNGLYKYLKPKNKKERKIIKKALKKLLKQKKIKKKNGIFFLKSETSNQKNASYKSPSKDFYIICRNFNIKPSFPPQVIEEAEKLAFIPEEERKKRKDYRNNIVFTIDDEDAKDLDDAISIEKEKDITTLYVHIADVSFYVKEGSNLDKEAYKRGTSIYLANRVVPMLPKIISNGICSLSPQQERLTLSVEIDFDDRARVIGHRIYPGIIRSLHKFTYEEVEKILNSQKKHEFYPILNSMKELSRKLKEKRFYEGSIDFDIPETKVICDKKSRPIEIKIVKRLFSHSIIEEFMLAANRVIATEMNKHNIGLFRVHEDPDEEKLLLFKKIASSLGFETKGLKTSKNFQEFIEKVKNTKYNYILNTLLLRSMKQAYYHHQNLGHFGLGFNTYTHFTSPIRRYPDLVVHRIIKEILGIEKRKKRETSYLYNVGIHTSKMERVAIEAERAMIKRKAIHFLKNKINKSFIGTISGFIEKGVFVSLEDSGIEGFIPRTLIPSFKYIKDYGFTSKKGELTLGKRVKVKLISTNIEKETIDFTLQEIY